MVGAEGVREAFCFAAREAKDDRAPMRFDVHHKRTRPMRVTRRVDRSSAHAGALESRKFL